MYHASCAFLCRRCSTTTWNCLILRFVERVKATQWFSIEKNCGYSLLEVNSSKIHHYFMNWVTWNKHGAMNFETTWIHFLRKVFPTVVFVFLKLPISTVKPVYNEAQGTGKICSLLRGFVISRVFPLYILPLLGRTISFFILRTLSFGVCYLPCCRQSTVLVWPRYCLYVQLHCRLIIF